MIQILAAMFSLVYTYLVPGLAVSLAIFPENKLLPIHSRIALSMSLSPSIVALSLFLSNCLFGYFEYTFIISFQALLVISSWVIWRRQRTGKTTETELNHPIAKDKSLFPKPVLWLFILATIFIMLFRFYNALLFPITNWDSLTEFAYLGRLYFTEGRIPPISGATLGIGSSANYPPLVPLIYTWFYLTTGSVQEVFAKLVSPVFSLITIIVTYSLAKEMYRSKALATSALFFIVTTPIFVVISEECLSDIVVTLYSLSSMYFLYRGLEKENPMSTRFLFVGGLFAGIAAFTKYLGLVSAVVGMITLFTVKLWERRQLPIRARMGQLKGKPVLVFLIGLLVFGAPWYLRNLVVVCNPVYPYLYQVFGGKGIDVWMMQNSWDAHFSDVAARNGFDMSVQSIVLTYYSTFFRVSPYEILDMGPFLGTFFAIGTAVLIKKRERTDIFLLIWALSYLVLWRFTFGSFLRYLAMILPAVAIISARGLEGIYTMIHSISKGHVAHKALPQIPSHVWMKIVVFLILFEGFLLPCAINGVRGYKTWVFANPFGTSEEYLRTRLLGTWDAIEFLNSEIPSDALILTYDHSLAYYVDRTMVFSDEGKMKELHLAKSDAEISSILELHGISYIVDTAANEEYFPLRRASYFYDHLDEGSYAQLLMDAFPSKVYLVKG